MKQALDGRSIFNSSLYCQYVLFSTTEALLLIIIHKYYPVSYRCDQKLTCNHYRYLTTLSGRIGKKCLFKWVDHLAQTWLLSVVYKFSVGLRSVLWEGHSRKLVLACFICSKTSFDVCLSLFSKFQPSCCWFQVKLIILEVVIIPSTFYNHCTTSTDSKTDQLKKTFLYLTISTSLVELGNWKVRLHY